MMRLEALAVLLYVAATISAQKYISFNREIMAPENDFSIEEWIVKEYGDIGVQIAGSPVVRLSKLSGFEHSTYQLVYEKIPLDFCSIHIHKKDGIVVSINGNLSDIKNIDITPKLSSQEALNAALKYVQAESYSWENKPQFLAGNEHAQYLLQEPIPQLVICPDFMNTTKIPTLAYRIELFSITPFQHQNVYVNASNGEIIHIHPLMKSVNGIAETRYSGTQTISTSYSYGHYRLFDDMRGDGISTYARYDIENYAYYLMDNDNIWTYSEYHESKQDAALDAHWGAMKTYDFFSEKYDRNSIDDNGMEIRNYVNYPGIRDNARWSSLTHSMYYGTGYSLFDAVTSLDVIAHELGHGITNAYQNNMLYAGETGAINESISDIWGACVEYYAAPYKQRWRIGEDITLTTSALRYMDNPKEGVQPDTYWGIYYLNPAIHDSDSVVHINSGVPNHWFYLLSDGGTGVNDHGYSYSVEGIGINEAADIIYETLNYLQDEMTFAEFAAQTRNVAINLYGLCSDETINLIEAWKAVGVPVEDIPDTVYISEALQTGYSKRYFARDLLVASNIVQNGATETLESENKIVFAPGFHAENGSHVIAQIASCGSANNRNDIHGPSHIVSTEYSSAHPINKKEIPIFVSPTSTREEIVVKGINSPCKYIIYDSMGRIIKRGILDTPYSINVAQFLHGTYILRISMNDGYSYVKFLKQ